MFTYSQFKSEVQSKGFAKQNRFFVNIGSPRVLAGLKPLDHVLVKSATISPATLASSNLRLTGEMIEVPYDKTFGQLTIGFYVDRDMVIRNYFDRWFEKIKSPNRIMSYYNDYTTTISINVLDINDNNKYRITAFECWPKSKDAIKLDQGSKEFMTLDVTFQYRYYEVEHNPQTASPL